MKKVFISLFLLAGVISSELQCQNTGQNCQISSDCCTGICDRQSGSFIGSCRNCVPNGGYCGSNTPSCCTGYCMNQVCKFWSNKEEEQKQLTTQ